MKCTYCDNENYLPDAIWNRLHPYKEPERIYLILDLDENDLKDSLDYFFTTPKDSPILYIQLLANHFPGFICTYFTLENEHLTTLVLQYISVRKWPLAGVSSAIIH